jgi:hypothetical protein
MPLLHRYYGVEAAKAVGEALLMRQIADTAEPSTFTPEEMQKYYGAYVSFHFSCFLHLEPPPPRHRD